MQGVRLPLRGGVITECDGPTVEVTHPGQDARALRWDYTERFVDKGWQRGDTTGADITVSKDGMTVALSARGDVVLLQLR